MRCGPWEVHGSIHTGQVGMSALSAEPPAAATKETLAWADGPQSPPANSSPLPFLLLFLIIIVFVVAGSFTLVLSFLLRSSVVLSLLLRSSVVLGFLLLVLFAEVNLDAISEEIVQRDRVHRRAPGRSGA